MGIKIKINGKVEEVEFGELKTQLAESWPSRDDLPVGDPIGDVDEENSIIHRHGVGQYSVTIPSSSYNTPVQFTEEQEKYFKMMKTRVLNSEGKNFDLGFEIVAKKECCDNPKKYKNIISNNLKFWSCSNCGACLGDI